MLRIAYPPARFDNLKAGDIFYMDGSEGNARQMVFKKAAKNGDCKFESVATAADTAGNTLATYTYRREELHKIFYGMMVEGDHKAKVYFDGLCEPYNPGGHVCYGFVIIQEASGTVTTGHGYLGFGGTNNDGEYNAAIKALERALQIGITEVEVYGDSMLVIKQASGHWEVKSPKIFPLCLKLKSLASCFSKCRLEWIPRERNGEADELTRIAYDEVVNKKENKIKGKAKEMLDAGVVIHLEGTTFKVKDYRVDLDAPSCDCRYFTERQKKCKHIVAADMLKQKLETTQLQPA